MALGIEEAEVEVDMRTSATEWLFTFITVKSTPPALESIGYRIYIFYTVMVFLGWVFVYLCIPETK